MTDLQPCQMPFDATSRVNSTSLRRPYEQDPGVYAPADMFLLVNVCHASTAS